MYVCTTLSVIFFFLFTQFLITFICVSEKFKRRGTIGGNCASSCLNVATGLDDDNDNCYYCYSSSSSYYYYYYYDYHCYCYYCNCYYYYQPSASYNSNNNNPRTIFIVLSS